MVAAQIKNIHENLVERCRENDREAQFKIYEMYYKAMYNAALRIVNDTAEAEDVMQEAFLDAFRKIDSYREEASFGAWLKRIVVNRALDSLKKTRDLTSIDEYDSEGIPDKTEDEDYLEVLSYKVEKIRKTIHMLPDNYRVILSLFLLEGYDHEEISQILNISNNLSRIRFLRAKRKLTELMREDNESLSSATLN